MPRLHRLIALVLLAIWLPATQHCGLEAAGVLNHAPVDEADGCCQGGLAPCNEDNCELLESGAFKPAGDLLAIPAPVLTACADLPCAPLAPAALSTPVIVPCRTAVEGPRNWVPTWQFVRRAAPSPRAPSLA